MKVQVRSNNTANRLVWVTDEWSSFWSDEPETDSKGLIEVFKENEIDTLYKLLGFSFHGQQQLLQEIHYQGLQAYPERLEDTCGDVDKTTRICVGRFIYKLGGLCDDGKLEFEC